MRTNSPVLTYTCAVLESSSHHWEVAESIIDHLSTIDVKQELGVR